MTAAVRVSETLTDARELAKRVHGASYDERRAPYEEILQAVMEGRQLASPFLALSDILADNMRSLSAGDELLLVTAAVEMVLRSAR